MDPRGNAPRKRNSVLRRDSDEALRYTRIAQDVGDVLSCFGAQLPLPHVELAVSKADECCSMRRGHKAQPDGQETCQHHGTDDQDPHGNVLMFIAWPITDYNQCRAKAETTPHDTASPKFLVVVAPARKRKHRQMLCFDFARAL